MKLIDSTSFVLAFLLIVLICQCVFGQVNTNLIAKLKKNTNGIEHTQKILTISKSNQFLNNRPKRQYFKPPIDGAWFSDNEKTSNLNAKRREASTYEVKYENTAANIVNNKTQKRDETTQVTVASLSISLINLFDRIKETLCNLINTNCKLP